MYYEICLCSPVPGLFLPEKLMSDMGTSMASGQQAGSSRERSDVADLEKQLVPLISKWWNYFRWLDERIRHHGQQMHTHAHYSFTHPNALY